MLTTETLTSRTPEARAWALEELAKFRNDGLFVPLSVGRQTVIFPGFDGGAEWGGQAFDPDTGLYYVNANDLAWTGGLAPAVEASTGARHLPAALRLLPSRRSAGRAAADPVARRHRAAKNDS